jgi:hypothetical protein
MQIVEYVKPVSFNLTAHWQSKEPGVIELPVLAEPVPTEPVPVEPP